MQPRRVVNIFQVSCDGELARPLHGVVDLRIEPCDWITEGFEDTFDYRLVAADVALQPLTKGSLIFR